VIFCTYNIIFITYQIIYSLGVIPPPSKGKFWVRTYFRYSLFSSSERRYSPLQLSHPHNYLCWWLSTRGSCRLQKMVRYTVGLAVRIFPATTRTFTKDTAWQGRSTASVNLCGIGTAWYVWISLYTSSRLHGTMSQTTVSNLQALHARASISC
jgi:hypothetical protein